MNLNERHIQSRSRLTANGFGNGFREQSEALDARIAKAVEVVAAIKAKRSEDAIAATYDFMAHRKIKVQAE